MTSGTTPVAVAVAVMPGHAARIAELLDYLADISEADSFLEGEELHEHMREIANARHWARELRDAIGRKPRATANLNPKNEGDTQ